MAYTPHGINFLTEQVFTLDFLSFFYLVQPSRYATKPFLIAGELAEQGSDKYEAAVFELTRDGKGKKMATLINEFGYFNQNGEFIHCNYHKEPQCRSYTSAEIDEKYQVTDADSEFYLTKYNDIAIHTIPEL